MFHLKAIELIAKHLSRGAVARTPEGREGMALAQYVAGMGFSKCRIRNSTLNGSSTRTVYDTPHGVAM